MKRIFDFCFSLILLIIFTPLVFLIMVIMFCFYGRPIFFKQQRCGLHGNLFSMLKFRTMIVDAEKRGNYFTSENDSRITCLGKILRKTSLDELPQLLNVIKGDMSLVGPRPDVLAQKILYSEKEWGLRCSVRPGITGLAQATLRSQATLEERKAMDLYYARHSSLLLDLKIILITLKQVIVKGGN